MYELPKRLVLDHSTWRCGGDGYGNARVGKGPTSLLNRYGYMCCIGQFCKQAGIPDEQLMDVTTRPPAHVDGLTTLDRKSSSGLVSLLDWWFECLSINDSSSSTIAHKVTALARTLRSRGRRLAIKNFPENVTSDEEVRDAVRDGILEIETDE